MSTSHAPDAELDPRIVIRDLRQRVKRLHRRVLDPDVLRAQLALRWPVVRRAATDPRVVERDRRFREAAPAYARALAEAGAPLPGSQTTTLDGLDWWVPLARPDDPHLVERALAHQDFPYRVLTQTRDVSIGGAMIDIGANIGRMSIPRVILGDALVSYCAEPDPLNHACLVRNAHGNGLTGLVLADQLAIGASESVVRLKRAKSAGGHRVVQAHEKVKKEVVEVPCLPLDTWVARVGIVLDEVRFVKLDVQGSEVDVLQGAGNVLSHKHIAWQIEIDLTTLSERGHDAGRDLYPLLQQHFTHFVDLNRQQAAPRVRPTAVLPEALAYVTGGTEGRTDVVLFTLDPRFSSEFV
jgi:FkbM family methyltransferase